MKLEDIKPMIAKLDAELNTVNAERDVLTAKAKALAEKRAKLMEGLKILDTTTVPALRTHVLNAMGIESAERVNGQ